MGEKIAKAAVEAHAKGNYVIAAGEESTSVARETRQGFLNVLKPFLDRGDVKLVSDQFNKNWSTDTARAQVENALTKNANDIAVVLCGNDGTAYGAIQAIAGAGARRQGLCDRRGRRAARPGAYQARAHGAVELHRLRPDGHDRLRRRPSRWATASPSTRTRSVNNGAQATFPGSRS